MCFSATASFVAGGVLSVVGGVTIAKAKKRSELLFASIPLLLGVQQIVEGVVWISFGNPMVNTIATYAYTAFSHVFWPIFIPLSVLLMERDPVRKRILGWLSVVGAGVGVYLLYTIAVGPVTACIVNKSIAYQSLHVYPHLMMVLYLIAVCGSPLISSHKIINIFGAVLLISFGISVWFFMSTFFSVWCFFATLLSGLIFWQIGSKKGRRRVSLRE
jgi:hypothetical protein